MFKGSYVALITPFQNGKVDKQALKGLVDFSRIEDMLSRTRGRIDHVTLDQVSPLAAPMFLEMGKVPVQGAATEKLVAQEAERLLAASGLA